jgi:putative transposase
MDTAFCIDGLEEAIERNGASEICNTDQGSQFTSEDFTGVLKSNDIVISMDGKRRWVDNVVVARLWRSVKYEEVYLHAYDDIRAAKKSLDHYFEFYNTKRKRKRKHQSLGDQTPDRVHYEAVERMAA